MASFVQIGNKAFNPEHVTDIQLEPCVVVYLLGYNADDGESNSLWFSSSESAAFMEWWETKADVHKLEVAELE